jgi:hypothetical protein
VTKIELLTKEAADYIYNYRKKHNLDGTGVQDWLKAEDFIRTWRKEYINEGDEFLRVWLVAYYKREKKAEDKNEGKR